MKTNEARSDFSPNAPPAAASDWRLYRTRFLVKARPLVEPLSFVDALGREHQGRAGDYLVESSAGVRSISPRAVFEDIYVPLQAAENKAGMRKAPISTTKNAGSDRRRFMGSSREC